MATLGDIKTNVKALGYEADQDTRIVLFTNQVQRAVVGDHRWDFMLATGTVAAAIGTTSYALPTSPALMHVESIRLAAPSDYDNPQLQWVSTQELLDYAAVNQAVYSGDRPTLWTKTDAANFQVWPAPAITGTFTVRYFRALPVLTSDADVLTIPDFYQDIVTYGVAAKLARRERQYDAASVFDRDRDDLVKAMKGQLGIKQQQNSEFVEAPRYPVR